MATSRTRVTRRGGGTKCGSLGKWMAREAASRRLVAVEKRLNMAVERGFGWSGWEIEGLQWRNS